MLRSLTPTKIEQIAALPLGGRIKLDPWSNQVEISHSKSVQLLGPREKMPFEVTPVYPFLSRYGSNSSAATPATPPPPPAPATTPEAQPTAAPPSPPSDPRSDNRVAITAPAH